MGNNGTGLASAQNLIADFRCTSNDPVIELQGAQLARVLVNKFAVRVTEGLLRVRHRFRQCSSIGPQTHG